MSSALSAPIRATNDPRSPQAEGPVLQTLSSYPFKGPVRGQNWGATTTNRGGLGESLVTLSLRFSSYTVPFSGRADCNYGSQPVPLPAVRCQRMAEPREALPRRRPPENASFSEARGFHREGRDGIFRCVRVPREAAARLSVLGHRDTRAPCSLSHRGKERCPGTEQPRVSACPGPEAAPATGSQCQSRLGLREGLPILVCCKNTDEHPPQTSLCFPLCEPTALCGSCLTGRERFSYVHKPSTLWR